MPSLRGVTGLVLRLAVTLGLLGVLLFVVADPRELARNLIGVSPTAMLLAVALAALDRLVMAYKWRMLLHVRGLPVRLWTAVRSYFASSLVGLVLPVTVGADALRVVTLRQFGMLDVTASIVIERIIGAIAMVSVAVVSSLLLVATVAGVPLQELTMWLAAALVAVTVLFIASLLAADRWAARHAAAPSNLTKITEAYARYRDHPVVLCVFYLLSVGESLIAAVIAYVVAVGLGLSVPLYLLMATVPIALASARLPVSLGGFGVQEASFVYLAGLVGIPATDALTIMLLLNIAMMIALLPSVFDTSMLSLRHRSANDRVL